MDKQDSEKIKNTLSYVYGLDASVAIESENVGVVYLHKDESRRDADKAIEHATNYIKGRYPKMSVIVFDKNEKN